MAQSQLDGFKTERVGTELDSLQKRIQDLGVEIFNNDTDSQNQYQTVLSLERRQRKPEVTRSLNNYALRNNGLPAFKPASDPAVLSGSKTNSGLSAQSLLPGDSRPIYDSGPAFSLRFKRRSKPSRPQ